MTRLYEGMFLVDNQVVREGWKQAKSAVTGVLRKHGAEVLTARRWDERRLEYPIKHRKRATYILAYFNAETEAGTRIERDLLLDERVLRSLLLRVEALPEGERELAAAEDAADFVVPEPPADDEPTVEEPEAEEAPAREASKAEGDDTPATEAEPDAKPAEGEAPAKAKTPAKAPAPAKAEVAAGETAEPESTPEKA